MIDEFSFKMDGRDKAIKAKTDAAAKAVAASLKGSQKLS
jgi:hypothetical protein